MLVHHLNCGTHCPIGGAFYDGRSHGTHADLCTHCLLIETEAGLVLVDTGYGLHEVRHAAPRRLARLWPFILNVVYREETTAVRQVEALGYKGSDVRHIILTHLDFDHAGGLSDFPNARVHVLEAEQRAAKRTPRGLVGSQRYRPQLWGDVAEWRTYRPAGERWFGFDAVRQLDGLPPEILMLPLPGHTLGHAGVAVSTGDGWLLNAGDAYLHSTQLEERRHMPPGLAIYERIMMSDVRAARENLARLRVLKNSNASDVRIFCSHDTAEWKGLARDRSTPSAAQN